MTRVAFVAPNLNVGGAEQQWRDMLPELTRRGFVTRLYLLERHGAERGTLLAWRRLADRFALFLHIVRLVYWRPDIVVTRGISAHVVGGIAARLARAPHLVAEHTPVRADGSFRPFTRRQRLLLRLVRSTATVVVAVANAQRTALEAVGFPAHRITVIPNGVLPFDHADDSVQRTEAHETFTALLVATLRPEKRAFDFVRAIEIARRDCPNLRGIVVGGGPELDLLRSLTPADGSITLLGPQPSSRPWIESSDVVCLVSEAEAMPLALLEGMAAGKPIVATRVGAVQEMIEATGAGIAVPVGDPDAVAAALLRIARDQHLADELGSAARRAEAETFAHTKMIERYEQLLSSLHAGRQTH